jgi:hypothetical protein
MSQRYIDGSAKSAVIINLTVLAGTAGGIVFGAVIANAPFIGAIVGCTIGLAIVGKLIFALIHYTTGRVTIAISPEVSVRFSSQTLPPSWRTMLSTVDRPRPLPLLVSPGAR